MEAGKSCYCVYACKSNLFSFSFQKCQNVVSVFILEAIIIILLSTKLDPERLSAFLCCYFFFAAAACQDATRLSPPQNSNSGLVVVLGPSGGFQTGSPFQEKIFSTPFHPLVQQTAQCVVHIKTTL